VVERRGRKASKPVVTSDAYGIVARAVAIARESGVSETVFVSNVLGVDPRTYRHWKYDGWGIRTATLMLCEVIATSPASRRIVLELLAARESLERRGMI
jgi:hypothetical protein